MTNNIYKIKSPFCREQGLKNEENGKNFEYKVKDLCVESQAKTKWSHTHFEEIHTFGLTHFSMYR